MIEIVQSLLQTVIRRDTAALAGLQIVQLLLEKPFKVLVPGPAPSAA
jgi:hypothetical protein